MTDLTRIINYFADNDGKTDDSLAVACKAVKDSLNKVTSSIIYSLS